MKKDLVTVAVFGLIAYIFLIPLAWEYNLWKINIGISILISVLFSAILGMISKRKNPINIHLHSNRATRRAIKQGRK